MIARMTVEELRSILSTCDGRMKVIANFDEIRDVFVDDRLTSVANGRAVDAVVHISNGYRP